MVRTKEDAFQQQLLLKNADNLQAVYDSVNVVSSYPWMINNKVLDKFVFNILVYWLVEVPERCLVSETASALSMYKILSQ